MCCKTASMEGGEGSGAERSFYCGVMGLYVIKTRSAMLLLCAPQQEKKLPPIYRGKWASASKEEVDEMMAQGVLHCYRFRVPKGKVRGVPAMRLGLVPLKLCCASTISAACPPLTRDQGICVGCLAN